MPVRVLCCVSACTLLLGVPTTMAQSPTADEAVRTRSFVQGRGVGSITLTPTLMRISVPIKVIEDTSWDATEKLREVRQEVVDRLSEMGADEDSIRSVGFLCADASTQGSPFPAPGATRDATNPQMMARCFVVADLTIRELEDNEAMIAMSQSQLEELTRLIPKPKDRRRSYSYTTLSSGLTSAQLDNPLALFVAKVSAEDRAKAFKMALNNARSELKVALEALGIEANPSMAIHQMSSYSSSTRRHPVESAIYRAGESSAMSIHPDSVNYTVRLNVSAYFEMPQE